MPIGRCLLTLLGALALALPGGAVAGAGTPAATPSATSTTTARQTVATVTPLKAPRPRWYTPVLHQRVLAAGRQGRAVPLPEHVIYPASGLAFRGIRPGSWIIFPGGCTTNFVFGSRRNYFIGTAGHCARVGETVTIVAAPGVLMNIGRVVKSVDGGIGNDFALIDVRPRMERHVNPSMTYFGGPTRAAAPRVGDVVEHAGHGLVIGTGGTPRAGVVVYRGTGVRDRGRAFAWVGAASPGDSGSPVRRAGGAAVGNLTHLVVGDGKFAPGNVAGTTIGRMLQIADRRLATAPNRPDPT